MNVRGLIFALLMLPATAGAQGFAGLGSGAEGFALPAPDRTLEFPADHAAHPDFRIEWWYLTSNLTGTDGISYGVQWTLFRSALAPPTGADAGWSSPQLWLGHAALTTPTAHFATERFARDGIGQAGVRLDPFVAYIDEWQMRGLPDARDPLDALALSARGPDFAFDLTLTANGPLVLQGAAGYSVKSSGGEASHYYSQPFYSVSGDITLPSGSVAVTGQAWLDREWSSQPLAGEQSGWDWVSLHFDDGTKLMGFQLREDGDGTKTYTSATFIAADGTATHYANGALRLSAVADARVADRTVPVKWRVELPARAIDTVITALNPNSWMPLSIPYWEGPVTIEGSHPGVGYLEMTGY
ncbi:MAG: putative secreted hydrolase [Paracoccaceae bacterium]|jgi:predicted secreted hydrolase